MFRKQWSGKTSSLSESQKQQPEPRARLYQDPSLFTPPGSDHAGGGARLGPVLSAGEKVFDRKDFTYFTLISQVRRGRTRLPHGPDYNPAGVICKPPPPTTSKNHANVRLFMHKYNEELRVAPT